MDLNQIVRSTCKVCLKSPGTDVGAAGFGMGVPGLLRQTCITLLSKKSERGRSYAAISCAIRDQPLTHFFGQQGILYF